MKRFFRPAVIAVAVIAVIFFAIAREWQLGRDAMRQSDQAMAHGELAIAVTGAKDAAQATAPFSPYPERGFLRLREIGGLSEQKRDAPTARRAWLSMRAAAMSTDALGHSTDDWRREADSGLVRCSLLAQALDPTEPKLDDAALARDLAIDVAPRPSSFLVIATLLVLVVFAMAVISRKPRKTV